MILHLTIWLVKSNIENAVATSLIGLLYGPIFPACLSMANDVLPAEVHMVAMALMWAILNNISHYPIDSECLFIALHLQALAEVSEVHTTNSRFSHSLHVDSIFSNLPVACWSYLRCQRHKDPHLPYDTIGICHGTTVEFVSLPFTVSPVPQVKRQAAFFRMPHFTELLSSGWTIDFRQ